MDNTEFNEKEYYRWKNGEDLDWNKICFVRALDNVDNQLTNKNGELVCQTAINSSQGKLPRVTVHWTINHLVASHFSDSWANSGAVLIAPGKQTVEKNGKPENLAAVDTFWSHDVTIPDGSTIVWLRDPSDKVNIPQGVRQIKINIASDEEYAELNKLQEVIQNQNLSYLEIRAPAETVFLGKLKKLEEKLSAEIDKQLMEMGYPVFQGDHGHYMGQPGVDTAVYGLAKKEEIKTSTSHVYTSVGQMEIYGKPIRPGPLNLLSAVSAEDLSKPDGIEDVCLILDDAISIFTDKSTITKKKLFFVEPLSEGETKQLQVFSAELFIKLISIESLMQNEKFKDKLLKLANESKLIKDNLILWSKQLGSENKEAKILLELLEGNN